MWATWTAGRKRRNNPCRRGGARSICSRRIITLSSPFCRSFHPRIIKRYNGKARVRVDNAILFHRNRLSHSLTLSLSCILNDPATPWTRFVIERFVARQRILLSVLFGGVYVIHCMWGIPIRLVAGIWSFADWDLRGLDLFELESDFEGKFHCHFKPLSLSFKLTELQILYLSVNSNAWCKQWNWICNLYALYTLSN